MHCSRCGTDIKIPDLVQTDKEALLKILQANQPLLTIKKIRDKTDLNLADAKSLMQHLNVQKGHCHRCNYQALSGENVICPKCKSVNKGRRTMWLMR
jgi:uncharacterized paraquat-inducible protein A